jgi:hypothetical protein
MYKIFEPQRTQREENAGASPRLELGDTPLTDRRSLGSSALVHLVFLGLASLTILHAPVSRVAENSPVLRGELEPVDNRASREKVPGEGGGSPGGIEIPGLDSIAVDAPASRSRPQTAAREPAADALLSEILPSSAPPTSEALQRALPWPGPGTTDLGLMAGSSPGGGGGSGGGSGGGVGRGIGPGTEFFGAREQARSFAYVIDCSGSMATRDSLEIAKSELLASLNQLTADARFAVIFYNLQARLLADPRGQRGLMLATPADKARVRTQLAAIAPDGGTDHMLALRTALKLRTEVIFFLTDADLMTNSDVDEILAEAGRTRIQAVEFGRGSDLGLQTPLRRLAATTGGAYRYIDVTRFPRSNAGN